MSTSDLVTLIHLPEISPTLNLLPTSGKKVAPLVVQLTIGHNSLSLPKPLLPIVTCCLITTPSAIFDLPFITIPIVHFSNETPEFI